MDKNETIDYEKEYSPSKWVKRYTEEEDVVTIHEELGKRNTAWARDLFLWKTFKYGDKEDRLVDVYGANLQIAAPAFVFIHGGYWQAFSKDSSGYPALSLVRSGIRVFVPKYSLAPYAELSEIVEDIRLLAAYVLSNSLALGIKSIWFGGHSAGAYLAASILFKEPWFDEKTAKSGVIFKGLLLLSGIYDLAPLLKTTINDKLGLSSDDAKKLSLLDKQLTLSSFTNKEKFKVIIAVGYDESQSFKEQSSNMEQKLSAEGIRTEFYYLRKMDHFQVPECLELNESVLTKALITSIFETINNE